MDQTIAAGPADITLAGGLSPYGTMGQGGNVYEWMETEDDLANNSTHGGLFDLTGEGIVDDADLTADGMVNAADLNSLALEWRQAIPMASSANAPVPEPSAMLLSVLGLVLVWRRPRRS